MRVTIRLKIYQIVLRRSYENHILIRMMKKKKQSMKINKIQQLRTWEEAMLFVLVIEFVNCVMACEKSGWESRAADRVAERAAFVPGSPNIL